MRKRASVVQSQNMPRRMRKNVVLRRDVVMGMLLKS
jgi:hypothetical protein